MTKKLTDFFDLPEELAIPTEPIDETTNTEVVTTKAYEDLDRINRALPEITSLAASDAEMDALAKLAIESYTSLMGMGMNIDPRVAANILISASQFLGHAITAKQSKINKKIKLIELQLKKAKLDAANPNNADQQDDNSPVINRNELLNQILSKIDATSSEKK